MELSKEERIELNKRNKNNYLCTPVDLTPIDKDELPATYGDRIHNRKRNIYLLQQARRKRNCDSMG